MKLLYYPGCTVKRNAIEYEKSSLAVLEKIGVNALELDKWYCCGALYSLAIDDLMKHLGAVRTLIYAQKKSREENTRDLLTICPMCFNVLKRVNKMLREEPEKLETISSFMDEEEPYKFNINVVHIIEVLNKKIDELKKNIIRNTGDTGVSVYYGCTVLRPKEIGIDNPEDPSIIENLLRKLGVKVVDNPYKSMCCGAYHILDKPELVYNNSKTIVEEAYKRGAKVIVTICPLCLYNLRKTIETFDKKVDVKIIYLTELLAYMLGLDHVLDKELIDFFNTVFIHDTKINNSMRREA
ncbi:MAG: heterodisulfide reductase, subunit B [Desulfurococcales archaeon ex4484_58]|nr:MAG: heterodisulfide reductase, subunit B [Desulfurococcales archaeon ex4484_58]